jgi:hypothetical protein
MYKTIVFWFRKQYNLSPRDPRFLALTPEEVEAEYYAHEFAARPPASEEFEDDEFDTDDILAQLEANDGDWESLINDQYAD